MAQARLSEANADLKVCPACQGIWLDRAGLHGLRAFLDLKSSLAAASSSAAAPQIGPSPASRAGLLLACAAAAVLGCLLHRALSGRPKDTVVVSQEPRANAGPGPTAPAQERREEHPPAAPEARRIDHDIEREARTRAQRALNAEAQGRSDEAEAEQEAVVRLYYAAIVAANSRDPAEAWRLEVDYAKAAHFVAQAASRHGQFSQAEKIQNIRLDIFERHGNAEGQATAWQGLGEAAAGGQRYAEAAERFDKAAYLFRQAGNRSSSDSCELWADANRRARLNP